MPCIARWMATNGSLTSGLQVERAMVKQCTYIIAIAMLFCISACDGVDSNIDEGPTGNKQTGETKEVDFYIDSIGNIQLQNIIDFDRSSNIYLGDFNNDKQTDVLLTHRDNPLAPPHLRTQRFTLYLNHDGSFTPEIISTEIPTDYVINSFVDFNSDGYLDIILMSSLRQRPYTGIHVLENTFLLSNKIASFELYTLSDNPNASFNTLAIKDVDGDEMLDAVLFERESAENYRWLKLDKQQQYEPEILFDSSLNSISRSTHFVDIDGDSDIDVVTLQPLTNETESDSILHIEENIGGGQSRLHSIDYALQYDRYFQLRVQDLNGDGQLEIIYTRLSKSIQNEPGTYIFKNLGNHEYSSEPLTFMHGAIRSLEIADLDNDLDNDFIMAYTRGVTIVETLDYSQGMFKMQNHPDDPKGIVYISDLLRPGVSEIFSFSPSLRNLSKLYVDQVFLLKEGENLDINILGSRDNPNVLGAIDSIYGPDAKYFSFDSATNVLSFEHKPRTDDNRTEDTDYYHVWVKVKENNTFSNKKLEVRVYRDDNDDDNDGVPDILDAFPTDPSETIDTDGDSIGNNADLDDDGDGVPDDRDIAPEDKNNWTPHRWGAKANKVIKVKSGTIGGRGFDIIDEDNSPIQFTIVEGDDGSLFEINSETGILTFREAPIFKQPSNDAQPNLYELIISADDDVFQISLAAKVLVYSDDSDFDQDGTVDALDAFPLNKKEWSDFDEDNKGDNADRDDDNDGVLDTLDPEPLNKDIPNGKRNYRIIDVEKNLIDASIGVQLYKIVSGDFDSDGDLDLVTFNGENDEIKYHDNLGEGNFSSHIVPSKLSDLAAGDSVHMVDFDLDDKPDLIFHSIAQGKIVVLQNIGKADFRENVLFDNAPITEIKIADINSDGRPDIFATFTEKPEPSIYSFDYAIEPKFDVVPSIVANPLFDSKGLPFWFDNIGNNSFEIYYMAGLGSDSTVHSFLDLDNDGDKDVITTPAFHRVFKPLEFEWFKKEGNNTYQPAGKVVSNFDIAVEEKAGTGGRPITYVKEVDFDGDGDKDIVTIENLVTLYLNSGQNRLERKPLNSPYTSESFFVEDIDLDGDSDIVVIGRENDETREHIFMENAGDFFFHRYALPIPMNSIIALGDFNGDGKTDVAGLVDGSLYWYSLMDGYTAGHL